MSGDPWTEPAIKATWPVPAVADESHPPHSQHFEPSDAPVPHAHMDEH